MENSHYYKEFPSTPKGTVRYWKMKATKMVNSPPTPVDHNKTSSAIIPHETQFIDDPNELLMSCSMRELNKPSPDVQWARILMTILEKTNRLETKTEQEVMVRKKLVKFSSNRLIELRKKLISS